MKPRWMRNHIACPECGHIYTEDTLDQAMIPKLDINSGRLIHPDGFNCVKCKTHFSVQDFWAEQSEKWKREHQPEENYD